MNANAPMSLHKLVINNRVDDVMTYLAEQVEVDSRDQNGCTALMIAVQQNNLTLAKVLIEHGADVNARDVNQLTPYLCAGANGFHALLSLTLANGADVTSVNRFGGTPLLPSSEKGFLRTVLVSLDAGIPVNHANKLGWSALLEAVILGDGGYLYADVIEGLLDAGAGIHLQDRDGLSALDHANALGQQSIVALMTQGEQVKQGYSAALRLVKQHIRQFDYQAALAVLTTNRDGFTNPVDYFYYCGYVLTELARFDEAITAYREGLALSDNKAQFYLYIANCYRLAKQTQQALVEFDYGIAVQPESPFVRYHKSNYLRELGMHEDAVDAMALLLAQQPHRYDYSFHQANSLRSLGRHDEAIAAIENAIKHDARNGLYYQHKAKSLEIMGLLEQAIAVINQAIEVCDDVDELVDIKNSLLNK